LHSYYGRLAVRFAEAGFDAVAIDYFGRTAGLGERGETFDYQPHIERVLAQPQKMMQDAAAAVDYLRSPTGPSVEAVFSVGFCVGGSWSWRLAASDAGLAGSIGFYGPPSLVADVVDQLRAPLLVLVAGADAVTPQQEFAGFARHLTEQGIRNEMYVYNGAPHSFFDRAFAQWQGACADAWQRMLDFMSRYTTPASRRLG
jgi:carboxymethylenebutenolidase